MGFWMTCPECIAQGWTARAGAALRGSSGALEEKAAGGNAKTSNNLQSYKKQIVGAPVRGGVTGRRLGGRRKNRSSKRAQVKCNGP